MNYCSNCGAKGSIAQLDKTTSECHSCHQRFWNNPKAAVAILFIKNAQILFSKRGIEPNKGKYDFPGGFVEYGEHPLQACVREIREETGVTIGPEDLTLLDVYAGEYIPGVSVVDHLYVASKWDGEFDAQDDSESLEWKPFSFIQTDDFAPNYTNVLPKLAAYLGSSL